MSLTNADHVLRSASIISGGGKKPFTMPNLIVQAWETDPDTFGIAGKNDTHPDTVKVVLAVIGAGGLLSDGLVVATDNRQYVITEQGKQRLAALALPDPAVSELTSDQEVLLRRLIGSTALSKVESGHRCKVWRSDMAEYFNFGADEKIFGQYVDAKITALHQELDRIESKLDLAADGCISVFGIAQPITGDTIRLLRNVGSLVADMHEKYLDRMRSNTEPKDSLCDAFAE